MKKLMIGGQALVRLGSPRSTNDIDFLIEDKSTKSAFIFDKENTDYINANGNKLFKAVWKMESKNNSEIASPKALLILKAYSFVQHCQNFNWNKVNDCEFDIKFLVLNFDLGISDLELLKSHVTEGEFSEVGNVILSAKK